MIDPRRPPRPAAAGAILILVAGIVSMLAALAFAFLIRMRSDAEEGQAVLQYAQCRLMLHAGMQFIQESSRLGYATDADRSIEAWGWIDVRDGTIGPKDNNGVRLWTPGAGWPAPGYPAKRAPMYLVKRPPCAVVPAMYPNRIPDVDDPAVDPNYVQTFGLPRFANPDPMPSIGAGLGPYDVSSAVQRRAWEQGDDTPDPRQVDAWFRVYRETGAEPDRPTKAGTPGATFILTVGAGGTRGYKNWAEVTADGNQAMFPDQQVFESMAASEVRQWFRVEWSAAVGGAEMRFYQPPFAASGGNAYFDHSPHARHPINASRFRSQSGTLSSTAEPRNYVGTISYIERLATAPSEW